MLSAASILGVEDCMPNRLEQVDNVIACMYDTKGMATAVNKYFRERSRNGKGVPRHLITYEDAMEALTVVDHESGPSPTQGSFARFGSPPAKTTPKPAPSKSGQAPRTPTAPSQTTQGQERSRGPRVFTPHGQCWQCGDADRDHKWNDCTHPCLNCGGPGQHSPGGHKTSQCKAPHQGPSQQGLLEYRAPVYCAQPSAASSVSWSPRVPPPRCGLSAH